MIICVYNLEDIKEPQQRVRDAAQLTREKLKDKLDHCGMEAMYTLKFEKFGYKPLEHNLPENLGEQIDISLTAMATYAAARHLIEGFPKSVSGGLRLNPGARGGRDIESICPGVVEAEVFAAVTPGNNSKLKRDIEKMYYKSKAAHRFVFFYSPMKPYINGGRQCALEKRYQPLARRVQVRSLERREVM